MTNELFNDELFMYFLKQSNPAVKSMWGFSVKSMNTVVPVIDEVNGEYKILRRVYFSRMMDFFVMDLSRSLSMAVRYLRKIFFDDDRAPAVIL